MDCYRFGGISGGAVAAMLICAGYHPLEMKEIFGELFGYCRENPDKNCNQHFTEALRAVYDRVITEDVYNR